MLEMVRSRPRVYSRTFKEEMLGQDCPNEIEGTREHFVKKLQLLHEGRRRRRRRRGPVHVAAIILVS